MVIRSFVGDGHPTMQDANTAPAGNNVYSSVDLKDFGLVSDDVITLKVEPMNRLIVREGTHDVKVSYTGANLAGHTIKGHAIHSKTGSQRDTKKVPCSTNKSAVVDDEKCQHILAKYRSTKTE